MYSLLASRPHPVLKSILLTSLDSRSVEADKSARLGAKPLLASALPSFSVKVQPRSCWTRHFRDHLPHPPLRCSFRFWLLDRSLSSLPSGWMGDSQSPVLHLKIPWPSISVRWLGQSRRHTLAFRRCRYLGASTIHLHSRVVSRDDTPLSGCRSTCVVTTSRLCPAFQFPWSSDT
jgi:hypothetical protein